MNRAAAALLIGAAVPSTAAATSIVYIQPEPATVVAVGAGVERRWSDGAGDTGLRVELVLDRLSAWHRVSLGARLGAFIGETTVPLASLRLGLWSGTPGRMHHGQRGRVYLAIDAGGQRSADHQLELFAGLEAGARMWFGGWVVDLPVGLAVAPLADDGRYVFQTGLRLGRSF